MSVLDSSLHTCPPLTFPGTICLQRFSGLFAGHFPSQFASLPAWSACYFKFITYKFITGHTVDIFAVTFAMKNSPEEKWASDIFIATDIIGCILRCSNKSLMPCLWWSTGCRCKLPHKWRVGSCCWATYKVPAKVLHWIDSCRFQLQRNWHTGEWYGYCSSWYFVISMLNMWA